MARNYFSDQEKLGRLHGWRVYVLSVPGFTKIGTATNVKYRISSIQSGNPHPLKLERVWRLYSRADAFVLEKSALAALNKRRIPGRDWCRCDPGIAIAAVNEVIARISLKFDIEGA